MDYFKSCTTNVRLWQGLSNTTYSIYNTGDAPDLSYAVLKALRQRGGLCSWRQRKLWIFNAGSQDTDDLVDSDEHGLILEGKGVLEESGLSDQSGQSEAMHAFLASLESSVSFALGREQITRLGKWTWTFPGSVSYGVSPWLCMQMRLKPVVATRDNLQFAVVLRHRLLRPVYHSGDEVSKRVIVAPIGVSAHLLEVEETSTAQDVLDGNVWRSLIAEWMQSEGIELDKSDVWVHLQFNAFRAQKRVAWPRRLCFRELYPGGVTHENTEHATAWKKWFSAPNSAISSGPLAFMARWFGEVLTGEVSKETASSGLDREDNVADPSELPSLSPYLENRLATSPAFHHVTNDAQVTIGAVYPTPPDGLTQGPATQQSNSDGPSVTSIITQPGIDGEIASAGGDAQMRDQSLGLSNSQQDFRPHAGEIFENMSEMDFGDNEVGDADFDYFDEPEEISLPLTDYATVVAGSMAVDSAEQHHTLPDAGPTTTAPNNAINDNHESHDQQNNDRDDNIDENLEPIHSSDQDSTQNRINIPLTQDLKPPELLSAHSGQVLPHTSPKPADVAFAREEHHSPEKPLSPFGVRERLLPPPIPASLSQTDDRQASRRKGSIFAPLAFNEELNLRNKYSNLTNPQPVAVPTSPTAQRSSLTAESPTQRRQDRAEAWSPPGRAFLETQIDRAIKEFSSDSDEDASSTSPSSNPDAITAKSAWSPWKRKRSLSDEPSVETHAQRSVTLEGLTHENASTILRALQSITTIPLENGKHLNVHKSTWNLEEYKEDGSLFSLPSIQETFGLDKDDLTYVAQIVSEQSVSAPSAILKSSVSHVSQPDVEHLCETAVRSAAESILQRILPDSSDCDIASLAVLREMSRPTMSHGKSPAVSSPGQSRLHQRTESRKLAPDCFHLPTPFVRVGRGADSWEMLPPALTFWPSLSLGPANGPKNVQIVALVPSNDSLISVVKKHVSEVGDLYESRKLGSWGYAPKQDAAHKPTGITDGLVSITLRDDGPLITAIQAYQTACVELGRAFARISHLQPDCTFVVFMIDPFGDNRLSQYLCACFWKLCTAYRDILSMGKRQQLRSDLILQLLPVELFASQDYPINTDEAYLVSLATNIYNSCPPSNSVKEAEQASALPILTAPSVELALPPPKRIIFQLSPDAPSDILHEGSVLHIAFVMSNDGQWVSTTWTDTTGRYSYFSTSCLRGRSLADVIQEIWSQTARILAARDVTWRVFIAALGQDLKESVQACWRTVVGSMHRKQSVHITLISIDREPDLQLLPPLPADTTSTGGPGQNTGVYTPATTPQSSAIAVSPDSSSSHINAPPTPANIDSANAPLPELGPDAHLIDVADESWGMILAPSSILTSGPSKKNALASGILFKRGSDASARLDGLGVDLHWDIRVRPGGAVDDGASKLAEVTLREVLRMFRNLTVLSKARGYTDADAFVGGDTRRSNVLPLHIIQAARAARGVNGMLR